MTTLKIPVQVRRNKRLLVRIVGAMTGLAIAPAAVLAQITVTPRSAKICQGGRVSLTATGASAKSAAWSLDDPLKGVLSDPTNSATTTFSATPALPPGHSVMISATGDGHTDTATITIGGPPCLGGEISRAVLGMEQVGASATPSSQSFVFDFFLSRPVPIPHSSGDDIWGSRLRWWGDIKVSSFPYTSKSSIATVAQEFATVFGNQNLNQFAESIEFVTGPEIRIFQSGSRGSLTDETAAGRFGLTWFAGGGATGPNNPGDNATVFLAPIQGSSQQSNLNAILTAMHSTTAYTPCPTPATPPAPCSNYLAFIPLTADRFLGQWGTGIRLYTLFTDKNSGSVTFKAPATIEVSVGQNASVTESHLHNFVLHVGAMYPFAIGSRGDPTSVVIYLFGEVNSALVRNVTQDSVILSPALDTSGNPIPVSNPSVFQIPVEANRRDTYRIGVGLDLISVWTKLTAPKN